MAGVSALVVAAGCALTEGDVEDSLLDVGSSAQTPAPGSEVEVSRGGGVITDNSSKGSSQSNPASTAGSNVTVSAAATNDAQTSTQAPTSGLVQAGSEIQVTQGAVGPVGLTQTEQLTRADDAIQSASGGGSTGIVPVAASIGGGGGGGATYDIATQGIRGVVRVPSSVLGAPGRARRTPSLSTSGGTTVRLIQVDDIGNQKGPDLATTTTDSNGEFQVQDEVLTKTAGNFWCVTGTQADNNLMRAMVTDIQITVDPAAEVTVRIALDKKVPLNAADPEKLKEMEEAVREKVDETSDVSAESLDEMIDEIETAVEEDVEVVAATEVAKVENVLGVEIDPSFIRLLPNSTLQFTATVTGEDVANTTVTWSVSQGVGTIDQNGLYTAPSNIQPNDYAVIQAASNVDPTRYTEASVEFVAAVGGCSVPPRTTYGPITQIVDNGGEETHANGMANDPYNKIYIASSWRVVEDQNTSTTSGSGGNSALLTQCNDACYTAYASDNSLLTQCYAACDAAYGSGGYYTGGYYGSGATVEGSANDILVVDFNFTPPKTSVLNKTPVGTCTAQPAISGLAVLQNGDVVAANCDGNIYRVSVSTGDVTKYTQMSLEDTESQCAGTSSQTATCNYTTYSQCSDDFYTAYTACSSATDYMTCFCEAYVIYGDCSVAAGCGSYVDDPSSFGCVGYTINGLTGCSGSFYTGFSSAYEEIGLATAKDASGNDLIYVADSVAHQIKVVDHTGAISVLAGAGASGYLDGSLASAKFNEPTGIAVDCNGNLMVADRSNGRIRKIHLSGTNTGQVTTVAGKGGWYGSVDHPTDPLQASFSGPIAVAVDASNDILVSDHDSGTFRKIHWLDVATGAAEVTSPVGLGQPGGPLEYVAFLKNGTPIFYVNYEGAFAVGPIQ